MQFLHAKETLISNRKQCFSRTKPTLKSTNAGDDKPVIEKDAWKGLLTIFTMESGLTGSLLSFVEETKK